MNPYQYVLSLRLRHPSLDLAVASERLGFVAKRQWQVGAPRATPTGASLDGAYTESYWCTDLFQGDKLDSRVRALDEALGSVRAQLQPHREFLKGLRDTGGTAEFFAGIYASGNFGIELPAALMGDLALLGLSVAIDAYP
jgi:hypothetical protein